MTNIPEQERRGLREKHVRCGCPASFNSHCHACEAVWAKDERFNDLGCPTIRLLDALEKAEGLTYELPPSSSDEGYGVG